MTGKPRQEILKAAGTRSVVEVLVDSIFDRQLVPLLGAGISTSSQVVPKPQSNLSNGFHNVSELVKTVGADLFEKFFFAAPESGMTASLRSLLVEAWKKKNLAELCELFVDAKTVVNGGNASKAHHDLCGTLRIADYVWLQPTRAHRLIAFLACEGLMPEVITTNYDCCLERAFVEAHGVSADDIFEAEFERNDGQASPNNEVSNYFEWGPRVDLRVSQDLYTYRQSARRGATSAQSQSEPYLRVYKINGCARAFRRASEAEKAATQGADEAAARAQEAAMRILLTERQLQSWRERQWAADMIRDRLRTRNILTCGFGSEEPQVRHTVGLITEEEAADGESGSQRGLLDRPNLIVVAGFDGSPTFAQHQVLTAQWNATVLNGAAATILGTTNRYGPYEAFLGPEARTNFKFASASGEKLPADDLWLELYGRVVSRLLQAEFERNEAFVRILRNALPRHAIRVQSLILESNKAGSGEQKRLFGWLCPTDRSGRPSATLASELIEAVDPLKGPSGADETRIRPYRSLRENGALLFWILTVRAALCDEPVPGIRENASLDEARADLARVVWASRSLNRRVRFSTRGPEVVSDEYVNVVLALRSPYGSPAPVWSADSNPLVRELKEGGRGTIRRAAPIVNLRSFLIAERARMRSADPFDDVLEPAILFPTQAQRQAKLGLRNLKRRD